MEQKENVDAGLGWLQKMIRLKEKHGTVTILTCLLLLLFACYVVFFGLNPRYLLDRMEATRTEQHDDATLRRLQADAEIRTEVQRLMHEVDADRVWVIELHNGSKNLSSGLPFIYGKMMPEEVADGIEHVDDEYLDFELARYPFIANILRRGYFYGSIEPVQNSDRRLYHQLKKNDVNEIALMTLRCGQKPLGILGISFCGDKTMNPPLVGEKIRDHGSAIAASLSKLEPIK